MIFRAEKNSKLVTQELLRCRPPEEIAEGLKSHEPIVYRQNGNRNLPAKSFLKKINKAMAAVGITRVADVSQLDVSRLPVFQTSRPNILNHVYFGQNSGSQGKGLTAEQAMISAIMESIETYCLEVRNPDFILGSYNFLKQQYAVLPPESVFHSPVAATASRDEKLLWTWAFHVETSSRILVPAETIFFPVMAGDYQVERHFMCGSNGLASGSTYLEAVNHALYEVIERNYWAHMELFSDKLIIQNVKADEFKVLAQHVNLKAVLNSINLVSLRFKDGPNIPVFTALYSSGGEMTMGFGCGPTLEMAATRAITEAVQAMTTKKSGARDDLERPGHFHGPFVEKLWKKSPQLPKSDVIAVKDLSEAVKEKNHRTLNDEYNYLIKWVKEKGYHNLCIANLTRTGVDIPVVKVLIPAMPPMFAARDLPASVHTALESNKRLYRMTENRK